MSADEGESAKPPDEQRRQNTKYLGRSGGGAQFTQYCSHFTVFSSMLLSFSSEQDTILTSSEWCAQKEMAAEDTGPERGRKEMPSRAAKRAKTTAASPAASASKSPKGRGRGKGKALRGKRRPAGRTARVVVSRTQ